ncbi:MAG: hypothetical protein B7Z15_23925 [Rhizobiales bacterium 32-66-8]|nr:MAG: hypothetical protein B7Z15_23925 [Rhizobiales bacterium 32-66-8]
MVVIHILGALFFEPNARADLQGQHDAQKHHRSAHDRRHQPGPDVGVLIELGKLGGFPEHDGSPAHGACGDPVGAIGHGVVLSGLRGLT